MWEKIKKILQKQGGKCIIIENNEPSYLVMKLDEYEKNSENPGYLEKNTDSINKDINELKNEYDFEHETSEKEDNVSGKEINVEDLPF